MNKSLSTNLLALAILVAGIFSPVYGEVLVSIGLFALSGALTNWLAVHMLFERVPLLYGSGVIPNRFAEFKAAIKQLIMSQFFHEENIRRFISDEENAVSEWLEAEKVVEFIDYERLFKKLVDAIMESSFGGMLNMFGGESALDKLREPFIEKMKSALTEMVNSTTFKETLAGSINTDKLSADMSRRIESIVDQRLDELTPQMVKQMVQEMIKAHLGWLVVWGGVFGGLIGLCVGLIG